MDALKPSIIRNDIEQTIEVDGFNLQVTSVRYANRIRESAKVCFCPILITETKLFADT